MISDGLEINGARMHVMVNILNRISHMVRVALDKLDKGKNWITLCVKIFLKHSKNIFTLVIDCF